VLTRPTDGTFFCPAHTPFLPMPQPVPRPDCLLCGRTIGRDLMQCPACGLYLDRSCLQTRAATGEMGCPCCGDIPRFKAEAEYRCIAFQGDQVPTAEQVNSSPARV
jgi:hypothetical protein